MKIKAFVENTRNSHTARVESNGRETTLEIPSKSVGRGSGVNGGELLFFSLATCYCNDIFREAEESGIKVNNIEVLVEGNFGGKGEPATLIHYDVKISAGASKQQITELAQHTDSVAEIQNTLRQGIPVTLRRIEIL